jgi:hypothetical protein
MSDYNESISGFKVTGDWVDVVKHGEKIAFALEELNNNEEYNIENEINEYDEWRPKSSENIREDINKKTAEKAMMSENKQEKEANKPQKDMKIAGEKVIYSYKDLGEPDEVFKNWTESIGYAARAFNVAARKSIRQVEKSVYQNLMTAVSPYYFDNNLISANMNRIGKNPQEYELEINVNDDNIKSDVSNKLENYGEEYDRWHVSVNKNMDAINHVEGGVEDIEDSDDDEESDPNPTYT